MKKAIHDKHLPHLRQALDAAWMAPAFEELFRRDYPEAGLRVQHCRIGRVYHKPGKDCGIVYNLQCRDREERVHENWFYGKMFANGKVRASSGKKHPASWPGCGFWKPASLWPETEMVLYAFPYDNYLPHLGRLLEPSFVQQQVEENLSGFDLPPGSRCVEVTCEKIKYMPNKRCVLRYEVVIAPPQGARHTSSFYSKTYDNEKSRYVYEVLQELCALPACNNGALNVPRPIAHVDQACTLWQHAWEGEEFRALIKREGWERLGVFVPKIAAMLAALHGLELKRAQLQAGPTFEMILENARADVFALIKFLPEREAALLQALEKLASATLLFNEALPCATIHGTFKLAQFLCREQQLALVDFDGIACGDPLYDVAELVASLAYLRVSEGLTAEMTREYLESFLRAYECQVVWPCSRPRLAWYVAIFLLGKMHSSLKRLEKKAAGLAPAFDLLNEWLMIVGDQN